MTQVVDIGRLNEVSDSDIEFRRELVGVYLSDTRDSLQDMRCAVEAGDLSKIAAAAHSIKGASSNVGAVGVEEAALALELYTRPPVELDCPSSAPDFVRVKELLTETEKCFAAASEFLEQFL